MIVGVCLRIFLTLYSATAREFFHMLAKGLSPMPCFWRSSHSFRVFCVFYLLSKLSQEECLFASCSFCSLEQVKIRTNRASGASRVIFKRHLRCCHQQRRKEKGDVGASAQCCSLWMSVWCGWSWLFWTAEIDQRRQEEHDRAFAKAGCCAWWMCCWCDGCRARQDWREMEE